MRVCEPCEEFDPLHDPLQAPLAKQECALVETQVSVEEFPLITDVGEAENERVGVGDGV